MFWEKCFFIPFLLEKSWWFSLLIQKISDLPYFICHIWVMVGFDSRLYFLSLPSVCGEFYSPLYACKLCFRRSLDTNHVVIPIYSISPASWLPIWCELFQSSRLYIISFLFHFVSFIVKFCACWLQNGNHWRNQLWGIHKRKPWEGTLLALRKAQDFHYRSWWIYCFSHCQAFEERGPLHYCFRLEEKWAHDRGHVLSWIPSCWSEGDG